MFNWFKKTVVEKASAVQQAISMQRLGNAVWTDRNYKDFADEGYRKNIIAFRAMNEVSISISQINWQLYTTDADRNRKEIINHAVKDLLRRPNEQQGGSAFFEALAGFYQIAGNAYIETVGPDNKPPLELYALRPDRMKITPGKYGPAGYVYSVNGNDVKWAAEDNNILHIKTFNPTDDWYGLSPMEAAAFSIDIHNAALEWNKSLLDNRCQPSGAVMYEPKDGVATLSEEEYQRLKQDIDEKFSGSKNAGRPLLLEGGLKWVEMGLSPQDMDYINSKHVTARDICLAYGVPPMLIGIPGDSTYSNMKEARLALWEQTVLPLAYKIRDELNNWLMPKFGEGLELDIDEDSITALSLRRDQLYERLQKADFLTIPEKRVAAGYSEEPEAGEILVPANMLPLGFDAEADEEAKFSKWLEKECGFDEKEAKELTKDAFSDS